MRPLKHLLLCKLIAALFVGSLASVSAQQPASVMQQRATPELLLLEVRLGQHVLTDTLTAYQQGDQVLLPLGELAKLLTLAIRTRPDEGRAEGYILNNDRVFSLDLTSGTVKRSGQTETVDSARILAEPDDLYVPLELLEQWLPVDLEMDFPALALRVQPRETLPLQARLAREERAEQLQERPRAVANYPLQGSPYRLLGTPFIDQTLAFDARHQDGETRTNAAYTAYVTGDLLGMESTLLVRSVKEDRFPQFGLTLGRHDPDAGLLGPLQARSFLLGMVAVPGLANIAQTSPAGYGLSVSNRPLAQPTSFDRHSLQGILPPGWDVELYVNDALAGFQTAGPDNRYSFEDIPLIYGPNEFRLVFHGPLGQMRVERQRYFLSQAAVPPGEIYYQLAGNRDSEGLQRALLQFDVGLSRHLSATAGLTRLPVDGLERQYGNLGLRLFGSSFILTGDLVRSDTGGTLAEVGVKTRLAGLSVNASRAYLNDFSSDFYNADAGAIRLRDRLSLSGPLPGRVLNRFQFALEAVHDRLAAGGTVNSINARLSTYQFGTSLSQTFRWQSLNGTSTLDGTFNVSRRVAGIGLSAQADYSMRPVRTLNALAFSADRNLGQGYVLNVGAVRSFTSAETRYSVALNKNLGAYGLGLSASHSNRGETAVGVQLFIGLGQEPRTGDWFFSSQPVANAGAASVRVYVDANLNGRFDSGEEAVSGARFIVNGGIHPARTSDRGLAYLDALPVKQHVAIAIDPGSLEDPQWTPVLEGVRVVPRVGHVATLDLPVVRTAEVDGTVYLVENGKNRPIGDVIVQLVDEKGVVAAEVRSASDGFYIVPEVRPGKYTLRVAPEQLERLGLRASGGREITVSASDDVISGADFLLLR